MTDLSESARSSISALARLSQCWSPSISPDGERIAFVSDRDGHPQVWLVTIASGACRKITDFEEQLIRVSWSPNGDWLALEMAPGGGMNSQIDIIQPGGGGRRRITAGGQSNNWLNAWTRDSRQLLFSSNWRRADAMDCYRYRLDTGETELLAQNDGTGTVEHISADGERLLLRRVPYRGDSDICLLDLASGRELLLSPHRAPATVDSARFSADGKRMYLITNSVSDLAGFCRLPTDGSGACEVLRAREDAELAEFAINSDETQAALLWNCAGRHHLECINLPENTLMAEIELPAETAESLRFSPDGSSLALCIGGSRMPAAIWLLDMGTQALRQVTPSADTDVDAQRLVAPSLLRYHAHDGLPLSGWYYAPAAGEPPYPTVLSFHGGPEGQEQPRFRYEYQALLARGIAIFAPNVRGSSGFGKRFVNLDNGPLRVDAIQDIASSAEHLLAMGFAQPGRLGIMGGSYGGYMTMAGLTEFPQLFAAGVNIYGLVNFKTFFALTEPWMARISKVEYGDPVAEGALLESLSPVHKLDRLTAPTLVLHGARDTNVPVFEAEQVVSKLRQRGVPVEYRLFPDEGHGFKLAKNRVAAAHAIVDWFVKYLIA